MPTRRYILHSCKNHGLLNEFLSGFNNYSVSVTGILKADAFPRIAFCEEKRVCDLINMHLDLVDLLSN